MALTAGTKLGRYEILALDLRGHGGSTRGPTGKLDWHDFDTDAWKAAVADLEAADAWLGERGFTPAGCVYVGSSIGASLVLRFAAGHPVWSGISIALAVIVIYAVAAHGGEVADAYGT